MTTLQTINPAAHRWLVEQAGSPDHWCKAFFHTNVKSDMLCNNLSESFNSFILDVRDKPIITMLELIRSKVMERIARRKVAMSKVNARICPKIKKLLDKNIHASTGHTHKWNVSS